MRPRLWMLAASVALVTSGVYVFVYLARWEWHRAIVAALLFLTAEVAVASFVVGERLLRVERRLDELVAARREDPDGDSSGNGARARVAALVRETAPPSTDHFAWLRETPDRLSVFVPILLGSGVVLSAVAWLLERVAKVTARPVLEHRLAGELAALTVPPGWLLHPGAAPETAAPDRARRRVPAWVLVVAAAAVGTIAVDALGDLTQNRPDRIDTTASSTVVVDVRSRYGPYADIDAARDLFGACAAQIGTRYRVTGLEALGAGVVSVSLRPALGTYAERRLRGCVADGVSDGVRAEVVSIDRA